MSQADTTLKIEEKKRPTDHLQPFRKGDLRSLLDLHRQHDFFPTATVTEKDISRRDIIEFGLSLQMVSLVEKAVEILANAPKKSIADIRQSLEELVLDIDTTPDGIALTASQRQSLTNMIEILIDRIKSFREFLQNASLEDLTAKIGKNVDKLPPGSFSIDSTAFPGALAVYIKKAEDYERITGTNSLGIYNPGNGQAELKGRILIINQQKASLPVARHEYFHFLFDLLAPQVALPDKAQKAQIAYWDKKELFEEKLAALKDREAELLDTPLIVQKNELPLLSEKIRQTKEHQDLFSSIAYAEVLTYKNPMIREFFELFKNEYFAYSVSQTSKPKNFFTYIGGEKNKSKLEESSDGRAFLWELDLVQRTLIEAQSKGFTDEELAYCMVGARSLSQAAKFIYLYLQQAPMKYPELVEKQKAA